MDYQFAQFNVAWLQKPLQHPQIADFRNAIDPLHADADETPGFVWRLIADGGDDATSLRPLGEDGIINCTVWESREAMAAWVYRRGHGDALKRRRAWFLPPLECNAVMWWIPAGQMPTLDDAIDRLQYLRTHGSTPLAFPYKHQFSPEDAEAYARKDGIPRVGAPVIGADQAHRCVDRYIEAWNEPELEQRQQLLCQVMTDDCIYADPRHASEDRQGLAEYIDTVLRALPGREVVRTTNVDVHGRVCRFGWQLVKADGTRGAESIDFAEFTKDGRLRRVYGFFGPLTPTTPETT